MRVFVAIPLSKELGGVVEQIARMPLFREYLRLSRIEPHITLKAPQVIPSDAINTWKNTAAGTIQCDPPQRLNLKELFFITPTTLCLRIESTTLHHLLSLLTKNLGKYDTPDIIAHEGVNFIPHITIGRAIKPITPSKQKQILQKLNPLTKPETITAPTARLYGLESLNEGYKTLQDIPFNGSS
jgi:2'-5' RNA ligase